MSSAPADQRRPKFFGIDTESLWSDLREAWRAMMVWPMFSWLWPTVPIRLWLSNGESVLCEEMREGAAAEPTRNRAAPFDAVLIPQSMVLLRTLDLPDLRDADLQSTLALEVESVSPFAQEDSVWSFSTASREEGGLHVGLVICARSMVNRHLETQFPHLDGSSVEMWVENSVGRGYLALPGFGGGRRDKARNAWRWASASLVFMTIVLMVGIAVTPSAQLYFRALQANEALSNLRQSVSPIIAQRESMARASDLLSSLSRFVGKPVSTLQVVSLVTQALPDDTFLSSLKISGLKVTMSGQSSNAATLMKQLGATAGFKDVRAPTAAVKPLGAAKEIFSIEFSLSPEQLELAR